MANFGKTYRRDETDPAYGSVRPPNFEFSVIRVLQDSGSVFVKAVHEPDRGDGTPWLAMSLIRTDEAGLRSVRRQISARYLQQDCLCASLVACTLPNGPATETEASKAVVRGFVKALAGPDSPERVDRFVDREVFVSHTPGGCSHPDRLDALVERRRPRPGLRYHGIDDLVAEGHFVALFSCFDIAGTYYRAGDLFRVAGGRIVEHWDVMEPVAGYTVADNDQA